MIEQLRRQLQALKQPYGIEQVSDVFPLGIDAIDTVLGGGLACSALHEVAALSEAHLPTATGFVAAISLLRSARQSETSGFGAGRGKEKRNIIWIAEDMALVESGAPYGPGLDAFGLSVEQLLTIAVTHRRDLLWAMEEALRCRAIDTVIGELRHGEIDTIAMRRLSLAASTSDSLALLLRSAPSNMASMATTRWTVSAFPSSSSKRGSEISFRLTAQLTRNRRGPTGSWILEWSESDECFHLATHTQPMAAPSLDQPHRKIA